MATLPYLRRHLFVYVMLLVAVASDNGNSNSIGINIENPVVDVTLRPFQGQFSDDIFHCERVKISGKSRLKLGSYANSLTVALAPSSLTSARFHNKIQVCFHQNASVGLCRCESDDWRNTKKGVWTSSVSPYGEWYLDVLSVGDIQGSFKLSVKEERHQWRLFCLILGIAILFLAPFISKWLPFYYSTSMAVGVLLVVVILLFQGMKLLPTGRKNIFYLSLYGSVIGAGTFILHYISGAINTILVNLGLSEEIHNLVYVFALVAIFIAGAALGYWIVIKFVVSKHGNVNDNVSQFVKWAMRIIGSTLILQSSSDMVLASAALAVSHGIVFLATSCKLNYFGNPTYKTRGSPWRPTAANEMVLHNRAEFFGRSPRTVPEMKIPRWGHEKPPSPWSSSPLDYTGRVSSLYTSSQVPDQVDYYSTYHKIPNRKRYTKKEWDSFTAESTREAMSDWAATPEVTDWLIENAERIKLVPSDQSSDVTGSDSDSTDDAVVEGNGRFGLFNW